MLLYQQLTDMELMSLLKTGDERSYTEIYRRYKKILYMQAYKKLKNQEESDDVLQETFETLWSKKEVLHEETVLGGYLYVLLRNKILNAIARKKVRDEYVAVYDQITETGTAITDHKVRLNMLKGLIEKEIAAMPPKMREIFEQSRNYHLSVAEIAEKYGVSEKTVRNQIGNALKILRQRFGILIYFLILLGLI